MRDVDRRPLQANFLSHHFLFLRTCPVPAPPTPCPIASATAQKDALATIHNRALAPGRETRTTTPSDDISLAAPHQRIRAMAAGRSARIGSLIRRRTTRRLFPRDEGKTWARGVEEQNVGIR